MLLLERPVKNLVKFQKRFLKVLATVMLLFVMLSLSVQAISIEQIPYETYTYSSEGNQVLYSTAAYTPGRVIRGSDLGLESFKTPSDIFYNEIDSRIYLLDTGNNRIISCDTNYQNVKEITVFSNNGKEDYFKNPQGIYIDKEGYLYVADTGNSRVLKMTTDGDLAKEMPKPVSAQLDPNVEYKPTKIAVSSQSNIYVVCEGIFEGLIELDQQGQFQSFTGMNLVSPTPWQLFWRMFSTEKQRKNMAAFLPVEFTNIDMDEEFIYAVSQIENTRSESAVKRLNPGGEDVLINTSGKKIVGDIAYLSTGETKGNSKFSDICFLGNGIYVTTDITRGRIFCYGPEGDMLFAFGSNGSENGNLQTPIAITHKDLVLYVVDSVANTIIEFVPTEYGATLLEAVSLYEQGKYDESTELYYRLLAYDSNCETAYIGIGKAQLRSGMYEEAMMNFKLASNRNYYSKAFKLYRKQALSEHFNLIAAAVVLLAVGVIAVLIIKKKKKVAVVDIANRKQPRIIEDLEHGFYICFHPFRGYSDMKYEGKGSVGAALIIYGAFLLFSVLKTTYSAFLYNSAYGEPVNILIEIIKFSLPVFLFCVTNWCFTTLMDGEGSFKNIVKFSLYGLVPYAMGQVVLMSLGGFLTLEESALYFALENMILIWTVFSIIIGNLTVHGFTLTKAVITLLLTVLGIAIIIFFAFLLINLTYEVYSFVMEIISEIILRT